MPVKFYRIEYSIQISVLGYLRYVSTAGNSMNSTILLISRNSAECQFNNLLSLNVYLVSLIQQLSTTKKTRDKGTKYKQLVVGSLYIDIFNVKFYNSPTWLQKSKHAYHKFLGFNENCINSSEQRKRAVAAKRQSKIKNNTNKRVAILLLQHTAIIWGNLFENKKGIDFY